MANRCRTFLKAGGVWICQHAGGMDFKYFLYSLEFFGSFFSRKKERKVVHSLKQRGLCEVTR